MRLDGIIKTFLATEIHSYEKKKTVQLTGLFPATLGKGPWPKLGKTDRLNSKIGRN